MDNIEDGPRFLVGDVLAYFFIPLPEPIGLPVDIPFPFPFTKYEDAEATVARAIAGGDPDPMVEEMVSLRVHRGVWTQPLGGFDNYVVARVEEVLPWLTSPSGVEPGPLPDDGTPLPEVTLVEAAVLVDPTDDDAMTQAFDLALERIHALQQAYFISTRTPTALVRRESMPMAVAHAVAEITDDGLVERSGLTLFMCNMNLPNGLTEVDLDDPADQFAHALHRTLNDDFMSPYFDAMREARVAHYLRGEPPSAPAAPALSARPTVPASPPSRNPRERLRQSGSPLIAPGPSPSRNWVTVSCDGSRARSYDPARIPQPSTTAYVISSQAAPGRVPLKEDRRRSCTEAPARSDDRPTLCEARNMDALKDLRMYVIREALDEIVSADQLIDTALRALVEGVESPSLPLLAGLSRKEESEAHDLFRAVASELDLNPPTPLENQAERWNLVRWLCEAISNGSVEPEVAGQLIWFRGWNELDYPAALQPMVGWVSEWDDWSPTWDVERDHYCRLIVEEARNLLDGPWPPE